MVNFVLKRDGRKVKFEKEGRVARRAIRVSQRGNQAADILGRKHDRLLPL